MDDSSEPVLRWLANTLNPPPTAAELAAFICKQSGLGESIWNRSARDAVLRSAKMTLAVDQKMRQQNALARDLAERLAVTKHALSDTAHTTVVALERLEELDRITKAAIAWESACRSGPSSEFLTAANTLRAEVRAHNARLEKRS